MLPAVASVQGRLHRGEDGPDGDTNAHAKEGETVLSSAEMVTFLEDNRWTAKNQVA
jgi:hypothetical protein